MNKIQFNKTKYELFDAISRTASHIGATIFKASHSLETIVNDVKSSTVINIYDDDNELIATYEGYTIFVAVSTYPIDDTDVVSIELANADIQSQIDSIYSNVENIGQVQSEHTEDIANLNNAVDAITPYTVTEHGYIGDTEVVFENVRDGEVSVFVEDEEGNYPQYTMQRSGSEVTVLFDEPLEYVTTVTISVL